MLARRFTWLGVLIVLSTPFGLAACGEGDDGFGPRDPLPPSMEISPRSLMLTVGETAQLEAILRAEEAPSSVLHSMTWSSSAPGIVAVSKSGEVTAEVTALFPGTVDISAECGKFCALARVLVLAGDDLRIGDREGGRR